MAFAPGYVATLTIGGTDISAFIKDVKFQPSRKDFPLPVLGSGTVRRMVGPVATVIDIQGYIDPTVAAVFTGALAQTSPTSSAFVYHPQGTSSPGRSGNAFVLKYDEDTPAEGAGTFTAQLAVDGTVTFS